MDIKSAFVISAMLHAALVAPFYNYNMLRHDFSKMNPVVVDYVVLKEMTGATVTNIAHKEPTVSVQAPPKVEIKKEAPESKLAVKSDDAGYRKGAEAKRLKDRRSKIKREAAKKEARIKSSRDYINYYDILKDRMRARLQQNYRFYKGEGDVYLSFALSARGELLAYDIDRSRSSKDEVLLQITKASLKAVSPFPPLPKAISSPKMSFNITIEFKK